jgi:hypothetical protein
MDIKYPRQASAGSSLYVQRNMKEQYITKDFKYFLAKFERLYDQTM